METAYHCIQDLKTRFPGITLQDKGHIFNTSLISALELGFMLDCAEAIIVSALTREESRGAHFRTDYLDRDDERWLKHILLYHIPESRPEVKYLPVRITQWQPQSRVY